MKDPNAGRGGIITDDVAKEMSDMSYGDLKPEVTDDLALGAITPKTDFVEKMKFDKFSQRYSLLLMNIFGTKIDRIIQNTFPANDSFLNYMQRTTTLLSIMYKFPSATVDDIVNVIRKNRVYWRNLMTWDKRFLDMVTNDLTRAQLKKETSSKKQTGPGIKSYPKYEQVEKKDFNRTVKKLHTPVSSVNNREILNLCKAGLKKAKASGDKNLISFWESEERKLKTSGANQVTAKLNKAIQRKNSSGEELDPRIYVGTMVEGPLNVNVLYDGTTNTFLEETTNAIISNRRLVENPWLELTSFGYREVERVAKMYNKKMPMSVRKVEQDMDVQNIDEYEKKLQPSMKKVIDLDNGDKEDNCQDRLSGAQPVGGDPNVLVKIESKVDKKKTRESLKKANERVKALKEKRERMQDSIKDAKPEKKNEKRKRVGEIDQEITKAQKRIRDLTKKLSTSSFMNVAFDEEDVSDNVECDVVPSNDPHVIAHDELEVALDANGFTLQNIHPVDKAFRTYVVWYKGIPLNGVGETLEQGKGIIGGALFAASQGTAFEVVGEGWDQESDDDGQLCDVFKLYDAKSQTTCSVNLTLNQLNFYAGE